MSHRLPMHVHKRGITVALGPVSVTIPDGSSDSSTEAPTPAAPTTTDSSKNSKSNSTKSTKTPKDATTSETSVSSSSFPNLAAPSTTSSSSSVSSSTASITSTSTASTTSHTIAAASTSTAASSSHSGGTSPGLVAFAVIICIAFVGAIAWVVIMRRHHKQREWTFQQHQRIFERFDNSKGNDSDIRPNTSHTVNSSIYPPTPVAVVDDGKAWSAGTGASVITTGPSVVRNLDWDQGPERRPKSIIEAKPKRKPVPPPKEAKKKTFSQYLPYLLPQNHSAEVIELGKAEQQVYQRPIYKPAG